MSTHLPGFQSFFFFFLHHFVLAKLATSMIKVKEKECLYDSYIYDYLATAGETAH